MNIIEKKAYGLIVDYAKTNYEKIDVIPGVCRYNFRCHDNAVHDALNDEHEKIVLVLYIRHGYPSVHFINYCDDKFIDNTVGHWCKTYDYHFVRFINKSEFFDVHEIHRQLIRQLLNIVPKWMRLISGIDL